MNTPTYPRKSTNAGRTLARLLVGERLKHRDVDKVSGSYRLSGHMHYLKSKHHWPHESREVVEDSRDPIGRTAQYTEYWFSPETIHLAGDEGTEYVERVLGWEQAKIAGKAATSPTSSPTATYESSKADSHANTTKDGGKCNGLD